MADHAGLCPETIRPPGSLWTEVMVVLSCTAFPSFVCAFASLGQHRVSSGPFIAMTVADIFQSVGWIVPVLYFMLRSSGGLAAFGVVELRWGADVGLALLLTVMGLVVAFLLRAIWSLLGLPSIALASPFADPRTPLDWCTLMVALLANSIAEELLVRAYLITKLEALMKSTPLAVMLAALIFASYHVYQGPRGANSALVYGLLMGAAFCKLRRIGPLVLAHTLHNILVAVV